MFGNPNPADPFSRWMIAKFDDRENMPAPQGFCSLFGRAENGSQVVFSEDANDIDIDLIRGNEQLAAMIPRGINSRMLSRQNNTQEGQSSSFSRAFPLIEEEGTITAAQLNKAVPGENRYQPQGMNKFDRMRYYAEQQFFEQSRRIARTYEFLASRSIITGQMPAIIGTTNPDLIYDFKRSSDNFFTVATAWSNVAADIMGDIDTGCKLIRRNGKTKPDLCFPSGPDMDAIIKNTTLQALADNRRYELVEISTNNPVPPKFEFLLENGFEARGRLRTPEGFILWLFTNNESFDDGAGAPQPYLEDNKTVIMGSGARMDAYFGPHEQMPMTESKARWMQEMFGFDMTMGSVPPNMIGTKWEQLLPRTVYPYAYLLSGEKGISIRNQAAPIFATTQTDAIVTITTVP